MAHNGSSKSPLFHDVTELAIPIIIGLGAIGIAYVVISRSRTPSREVIRERGPKTNASLSRYALAPYTGALVVGQAGALTCAELQERHRRAVAMQQPAAVISALKRMADDCERGALTPQQVALTPDTPGWESWQRTADLIRKLSYPNNYWAPVLRPGIDPKTEARVGDVVRVVYNMPSQNISGQDVQVTFADTNRVEGYVLSVIRPSGQLDQYWRDPRWLEGSRLVRTSSPRSSIVHVWRGAGRLQVA